MWPWSTRALRRIERSQVLILTEMRIMQKALEELEAAVEQQTSVTQSAVTMLEQLAAQVRENADDPAALRKLAADIEKNTQRLSDALVANTDAEADEA